MELIFLILFSEFIGIVVPEEAIPVSFQDFNLSLVSHNFIFKLSFVLQIIHHHTVFKLNKQSILSACCIIDHI